MLVAVINTTAAGLVFLLLVIYASWKFAKSKMKEINSTIKDGEKPRVDMLSKDGKVIDGYAPILMIIVVLLIIFGIIKSHL
jgi:hypothetical protein